MSDIDSKELTHGQGAATRVPAQLKRLVGKSSEGRVDAFDALRDTLVRQKSWFTASGAVVQALLESLDEAPEQDLPLLLVAEMLGADHVRGWLSPSDEPIPEEARPSFDAALAHEEALLRLLRAKKASARAAAALVLAMLPALSVTAVPELLKQAESDKDAVARASALLAVARLGAGNAACRTAIAAARRAEMPLVRGAAAIAWVRFDAKHSFVEVEKELLDWLAFTQAPWDGKSAWLPWFGGAAVSFYVMHQRLDFAAHAAAALARSRNATDELTDVALRFAERDDLGPEARRLGKLVLELSGLLEHDKAKVLPFEQLPEPARTVAKRLARTRLLPLAGHGLPAAGAPRQRWAGLLPAGPLERELTVSVKGAETTLAPWQAFLELVKQRAWGIDPLPPPLSEQLNAHDRWQAIGELSSFAYGVGCRLESETFEQELARVPLDGELVRRAAELADDLARRFEAARRDEEPWAPSPLSSAWVLLPLIRAGRAIEQRWEPLVPISREAPAREVFGALALERREPCIVAHLTKKVPRTAVAGSIEKALAVIDLCPTAAATAAVLRAIEQYREQPHSRADALTDALQALAKKSPTLEAALAAARQSKQ